MSDDRETDQLRQRRENLSEVRRLGVDVYPRSFGATATVSTLIEQHADTGKDTLELDDIQTAVAGRIVAIRSFGKANFVVISDGRSRIQVYVRQDSMPALDFSVFELLLI